MLVVSLLQPGDPTGVLIDILTFSAIDLWEVKGGGDKPKIQDGFAGPGKSSVAESF